MATQAYTPDNARISTTSADTTLRPPIFRGGLPLQDSVYASIKLALEAVMNKVGMWLEFILRVCYI